MEWAAADQRDRALPAMTTGEQLHLPTMTLVRTFATMKSLTLLGLLFALVACDREVSRPRSTPISFGDTVQGQLERDDWTDVFIDGSFTDLYEIELRAGQQITVEMQSDSIDTYVSFLRGPGDQIADNDDIGEGNTNSRLSYRAPADIRFFIAATTFRAGQTGPYTLSVRAGEASPSTRPTKAVADAG